jgi:phage replication-related protein YjqB (UPF0714/DUF867 family)
MKLVVWWIFTDDSEKHAASLFRGLKSDDRIHHHIPPKRL